MIYPDDFNSIEETLLPSIVKIDRTHFYCSNNPYMDKADIIHRLGESLEDMLGVSRLNAGFLIDLDNADVLSEIMDEDMIEIVCDTSFDSGFPSFLMQIQYVDVIFVVVSTLYEPRVGEMMTWLRAASNVPIYCILDQPLHYMMRSNMYPYLILSGHVSYPLGPNKYETVLRERGELAYDEMDFLRYIHVDTSGDIERYSPEYLTRAIHDNQTIFQ